MSEKQKEKIWVDKPVEHAVLDYDKLRFDRVYPGLTRLPQREDKTIKWLGRPESRLFYSNGKVCTSLMDRVRPIALYVSLICSTYRLACSIVSQSATGEIEQFPVPMTTNRVSALDCSLQLHIMIP